MLKVVYIKQHGKYKIKEMLNLPIRNDQIHCATCTYAIEKK